MSRALQAVVLAAGRGTRMKTDVPKVLHPIFDRPLIDYSLDILRELGVKHPLVIAGWGREKVAMHLKGRAGIVVQSPQLGTGHAVQTAKKKLAGFRGQVLIWPADMILVRKETIRQFIRDHRESGSAVSILSSFMPDPTGYGRMVRRGGRLTEIREELDASPEEKKIKEINTGIYLFHPRSLFQSLEKIKPTNKKKEYYLTDSVRHIREAGGRVEAFPIASSEEAQGINSQADLACAFRVLNQRTLQKLQAEGVTIISGETTFIAPDAVIGPGTVIHPCTYIEGKVRIGKKCQIGPFAKIRSGSVIEEGAVIGSFVEIVRSRIGKKVFAKHLSYLGDTVIGDETNVGAGTITANYDGKNKNRTRIGKKSFIGVGTVFIAPVRVGDRAKTGAGSVLTRGTHVKSGAVYVGVPARPLKSKTKKKNK